ncbi:MAG: aquaporin family protein [Acidobacteria bacterium]|jgi:glycerol uptake facilitator protein|nr:aquaporin family protein [Acidobacteriota bacterium]
MSTSRLLAEIAAEFFGTMIILLIGGGVVASVVLFGSGVPGEVVNGGTTNINLAWGLAVMLGVFVSAKISGAHLNPAVTLALAVFRGFSWSKVAPYFLAQIAGAFSGAAIVFFSYREAFLKFDPALEKTAGVFATFPAFPAAPMAGFFDQLIGTALLLFLILAISDEHSNPPPAYFAPVLVGLIVVAIGMSFGAMHGYAINPARDFGPRLFTVLAGFRNNGLTDGSGVFWVPIAGPLVGGLVGAAAYDFGIRRFLR